ncbi:MAG TPA: DinB family protein [Anaerolineae bacterium]|nr:DinB family protein [Anaerolineae bacterium]
MPEVLTACVNRLEELHRDLNRALEGLPAEALNWSPGPEMNSMAVLAAHTAGSERYWIGDVIARDDSHRDRAAEFRAQATDASELIARLDAALAHSRSVVERLTLSDLEEKRTEPPAHREVTVAWALLHAVEHVAVHLGHMQLLHDMWQAQAVSDIAQIHLVLQRFQDGYTQRDVTRADEIMQLFADDVGLEVIGTNGIQPGVDEWYLDKAGARGLVKGDWEGWGDVRFDVAGAHIQTRGDVAWLATTATVAMTIGAEENYRSYLQRIKDVIDQNGPSAEIKLLDILRGGSNTLYELRRGEQFVWPLRFTAVLVRQAGEWRFQQMQFSFPTTRFPDERIVS